MARERCLPTSWSPRRRAATRNGPELSRLKRTAEMAWTVHIAARRLVAWLNTPLVAFLAPPPPARGLHELCGTSRRWRHCPLKMCKVWARSTLLDCWVRSPLTLDIFLVVSGYPNRCLRATGPLWSTAFSVENRHAQKCHFHSSSGRPRSYRSDSWAASAGLRVACYLQRSCTPF